MKKEILDYIEIIKVPSGYFIQIGTDVYGVPNRLHIKENQIFEVYEKIGIEISKRNIEAYPTETTDEGSEE